MADSLTSFNENLQQMISYAAAEEGAEQTLPSTFTAHMLEVLTESGDVENAFIAGYEGRGARASGYELSEDSATLHVFLTDYRAELGVQSLGKTELNAHVKRMSNFVVQASEGLWNKLEETATGWEMAKVIADEWGDIAELRFTILTNAELRTEVPATVDLLGRTCHFSVWDIDRLHKLDSSGRNQEPISVDVVDVWGDAIPCLGPHGEQGAFDAYLVTLPGEFLAQIYEMHGPRLLELNVRSFLQARNKVNKGIQDTLRDEPERFLAYNNGVSMTASSVELVKTPSGGNALSAIHDLQIVNGGQTTASLHHAKVRNKQDLSQVWVQGKLSVVVPEHLEALVPRISQFANSQNRVNMADFTANDPFHVELEKLSRTVWAPSSDGGTQLTRWFYERARGQYADAIARERTPAKQRAFKRENPVSQKFTKTDAAKFENTWDQLPWLVSRGSEKNFREFMLRLSKRGAFRPDVRYFERLAAKALLFRSTEKLVGSLQLGGYRAQTVTYALAKLLHVTGQRIDLDEVWRRQALSDALAENILTLGRLVHEELVSSAGTKNVSEWAKREDCWKVVLDLAWVPTTELSTELMIQGRGTKTTQEASLTEALSESEQIAMDIVFPIESTTWFELAQWAKETNNFQAWQRGLSFSLGKLAEAGKPPSRKQAVQGQKSLLKQDDSVSSDCHARIRSL